MFKNNNTPWNKGLTKKIDVRIANAANSAIGKKLPYVKRTQKECPKCKRKISVSNFTKHEKVCTGPIDNASKIKIQQEWKIDENKFRCPFCFKIFSFMGIGTHIWRMHKEGVNHKPSLGQNFKCRPYTKSGKKRISWNQGLTKETDERIRKTGEIISALNKRKVLNGTYKITPMNQEARTKLSIRQSLHNSGGKCKWYTIANQKVQGTWELYIAQIFEEFKIQWISHRNYLDYKIDNKIKRYTPDFYLPKFDIHLEIKGYWWGNDKEKMECVLKQHQDKKFIVIEKKDFLLLKKDKKLIFDFLLR